ncbi:MAG: hypothetical protein DRR19_08145 [Candidatus Parabeggiatoa sp. nov. 1]|nr:MAG: hypothetical protein DRR19_08145 [Gammaproteobacteria bacterium]
MKFSDLVDIDELQSLCENVTKLTGIAAAIIDLEGNVLVATGWQKICAEFHRVAPGTSRRCIESDTVLACQLQKGERYNVYKCKNGLVDVAVPIIIGGVHRANLFTGQFLLESPDIKFFAKQAEEFGFDKAAYLNALSEVPILSKAQVEQTMNFLSQLASVIGEMGLKQAKLNEALTALEEHNKLKDEFLANTSHELRTPLNGIIGIAQSLIDGATGELAAQTKTNLAMIVSSGKRLAALVNDILDFSKLKHKEIELQLKPVGLRELVDVVLTLSQPLVAQKPVALVNAIEPDLPCAFADENRLQQILHNLVNNAIKFTTNGYITVSAQVVNPHLQMTVSDTGIGIEEDKLERIFESFEQAEGSIAREYGGTGLGLAITKKLVELHQGTIWTTSIVGVGSQFILTLPLSEEKASPLPEHFDLSKVQNSASDVEIETVVKPLFLNETPVREQFKILIVDDEPVNLQVLHNYLSLQNYRIIQASSGQKAFALIEEGLKPDLVLLDVMMPRMTGYEVTHKLREKWQAIELPILLLTAKNQVEDLVMGLEAGANDYLTKPISKEELMARIKTHLFLKTLAAENMRMQAELEITRRLQQMVLPSTAELQQIEALDIAGFMEPAEEVGGDYYDVFQQNGHVKIAIGDVTGHGLESGVLMLMVQTAVRSLFGSGLCDATQCLNTLNRMIYNNVQRMKSKKNLTLSLLDYQNGRLQLTGQHEYVLWVHKDSYVEPIDTLELGFIIGMVADIAKFVSQKALLLQPGDGIVLYTDGITEALNPEKVEYGLERLCQVISCHWQHCAKDISQTIIADVRQHIGTQKVFDDMTLLVLKRK